MAGKGIKQLAGSGTGQSFVDRMNAAKYSITGSSVAKVVCKATTEEIVAPKSKHIEYLIRCTNEPNISIPALANLLIERSQQTSWVVVFKALITMHNVMNYGNDRFSQYLASNNCQLSLPNFTDKSGVQAYDMSMFIRHYSKYINEKAATYRSMAFDFCKIKRGKDDGVLRTMALDKLLKTIPVLQHQIDILMEFDVTSNELTNRVLNVAFLLVYKDLIRLFATYNEGMINLIEKYFSLNKKQCREALDLYKRFLVRMDRVNEFLKVAECLGCGDNEGLTLQSVPSSVLESLEEHLATLEGRKVSKTDVTTSSSTTTNGVQSKALVPTSSSPSLSSGSSLSEAEKQRIIEDEKRRLAEFAKSKSGTTSPSTTVNSSSSALRFNSSSTSFQTSTTNSTPKSENNTHSQDLLLLALDAPDPAPTLAANNPFASTPNQPMAPVSSNQHMAPISSNQPWSPFASQPSQQVHQQQPLFNQSGFNAFGNSQMMAPTPPAGYNTFGEILQPVGSNSLQTTPPKPLAITAPPSTQATSGISADLDSSLANLAGNLSIVGPGHLYKTEHKWNQSSPKSQQKMGGSQPMAPSSTANSTSPFGASNVQQQPPMNWNMSQPLQNLNYYASQGPTNSPGGNSNPFLNTPVFYAQSPGNRIPAGQPYSYGQPVSMAPWPSIMRGQQYPGVAPPNYNVGVSGMGQPSSGYFPPASSASIDPFGGF